MCFRWVGILLFGWMLCASVTDAAAAALAGTVVGVDGQCTDRSGSGQKVLRLSDQVYVGDVVVVPKMAKLKLRMIDGSVVSLASSTQLRISTYRVSNSKQSRDGSLALVKGLLRAVVTRWSGPSTFEVKTAVGVAAVRSTDWFIEARPASTQVGVLSGKVTLTSNATHRSTTIPARWGARLEAGLDPVPARLWTNKEFERVIKRTTVN